MSSTKLSTTRPKRARLIIKSARFALGTVDSRDWWWIFKKYNLFLLSFLLDALSYITHLDHHLIKVELDTSTLALLTPLLNQQARLSFCFTDGGHVYYDFQLDLRGLGAQISVMAVVHASDSLSDIVVYSNP